MHTLIKDVQQFFADQMENHGFGRKTFIFETDTRGRAVVHRVRGKFNDAYYQNSTSKAWEEISERFAPAEDIYLTAIDISSELIDNEWCGRGGVGGRIFSNVNDGPVVESVIDFKGKALIPASGSCFDLDTTAHELGHAFGLDHDFRNDAYIMSYGANSNRLSRCATRWLDAHECFNVDQIPLIERPNIQMFPISFTSPTDPINLRFEVTGAHELYQAQLIIPTTATDPADGVKLHSCKSLSGLSDTVEFRAPELTESSDSKVRLQVIDVHGNFIGKTFPIRTPKTIQKVSGDNQHSLSNAALLFPFVIEVLDAEGVPVAEVLVNFTITAGDGGLSRTSAITDTEGKAETTLTLGPHLGSNAVKASVTWFEETIIFNALAVPPISIPDPNLQAAIETALNKSAGNPIAPVEMATLTDLVVKNTDITDLTGIEFAINLTSLHLDNVFNNETVDFSLLTSLTKLTKLSLRNNSISDISDMMGLTELTDLRLSNNFISDISPLARLTKLEILNIGHNAISDISALEGLTELKELNLSYNAVHDLSALVANKGLQHQQTFSGASVNIRGNPLSRTSIKQIIILQNRRVDVKMDPVKIPDPKLQTAVKRALNKFLGDPIMPVDMITLTRLAPKSSNITDLTGLEFAFNLTSLQFDKDYNNAVVDLAPLANLTKLTILGLEGNAISDLSPLANLTELTTLNLGSNAIVDLTPLTNLTELTTLNLEENTISDISPLTNLTKLTTLNLGSNAIVDLTPLANLTKLTTLNLEENTISDISPLVANVGLGQGSVVNMRHNPLNETSMVHISTLRSRGVTVEFFHDDISGASPTETALLPNYPNPFNPETAPTSIPYHLLSDVDVTLTIHDVRGRVLRRLELGHQKAGYYTNQSRAAYWDGRNEFGEPVASGVYFYTLTAGEFTATRKMLIRK